MAKTLYFDCFSGASGDMILGALLDLGLPLEELRGALGSLPADLGGISAHRVLRAGVSATKFSVTAEPHPPAHDHPHSHDHGHPHEHAHPHAHEHPHDREHPHDHPHPHAHEHRHEHPHDHGHPHRHDHGHPHDDPHSHDHDHAGHRSLKEIAGLINRSALSPVAKDRAVHLFERLADAEAAIHAMPVARVHLHEVGAIDSIVDIVGAVHGLEQLGAEHVVSSPLNVGGGTVRCAHGVFPVPAPATARLLQGVPVYAGDVQMELVTPTGALIVTGYAQSFGPLPAMTIEKIGYGAGERDPAQHPNVLRLLLGRAAQGGTAHRVVEVTCEIDDMNPQLFGPLMDRLHAAGALDVFYASVQMKKNRPGTLVTVLARPEDREQLSSILFAETTTIGVRYQEMLRECLDRAFATVETPLGPVRFKVASRGGRVLNASPEFDDCSRLATARGMPIKEVQAIALRSWLDRQDAEDRRTMGERGSPGTD